MGGLFYEKADRKLNESYGTDGGCCQFAPPLSARFLVSVLPRKAHPISCQLPRCSGRKCHSICEISLPFGIVLAFLFLPVPLTDSLFITASCHSILLAGSSPPNDLELVLPLISVESVAQFRYFVLGKPNCSVRPTGRFVSFGLYVGRDYRVSATVGLSKGRFAYRMHSYSSNSPFIFCRGTYDSVLGTAHFLPQQFYHGLHDMVFPISLIPPEIVRVSWYVARTVIPPAREALELLGIGSRILQLNDEEYIMARRVYVFPEFISSTYYTWTIKQRFRAIAVERWGLDGVMPKEVGVVNRPMKSRRRVDDLAELADDWRRQWPAWKWEYKEIFLSLREAAGWFNDKKCVVAVTGAGCLNAIFMQKGACLVELQSDTCFEFFVHLEAAIGLEYISMQVPGMNHWHLSRALLGRARGLELTRFIVSRYSYSTVH
jgi:hypothetical protein